MKKTTTSAALSTLSQQFKLDAKVGMDDIVNIFVSQHEEQLHQQRAAVQKMFKETQSIVQKTIELVKTETLQDVLNQLNHNATKDGLVRDIYSFDKDDHMSVNPDNNVVMFSVTRTTKIIAMGTLQFVGRYNGKFSEQVQEHLNLSTNIGSAHLATIKQYKEEADQLQAQLVEINAAIQGIDRKTRQIKAVLAQKNLEAAGLNDVLTSPEIQTILQLK